MAVVAAALVEVAVPTVVLEAVPVEVQKDLEFLLLREDLE